MQHVSGQEEEPGFVTSNSNVGYIDSAIPGTQFRLRFDSAFDNPTPDRVEFFYRASTSAIGTPISPAETNVDYNDITAYAELALGPETSVFVEAPYRFLNPERNANATGFSDLIVGGKRVLWLDEAQIFTGQFRVFIPTGDADRLLGTDHVSLEPGLLAARRISPLTLLEGEMRLWIPVGGTEIDEGHFAAPVLRLGAGIGHDLYFEADACGCQTKRLSAVTEFVGWTIFDGFATIPETPELAQLIEVDGDTIINGKFGLRWTDPKRSIFVGYGRALTGDVWYHNILRAEYVMRF
ncbi:MAG: hypothetical protein AAF958_08880 [Planctomycetota bacterium]